MPTESLYPRFRTKSGQLTAYSFACGYVQTAKLPNGAEVQLYHEGACFHCRAFGPDGNRIAWESATGLGNAQRLFRKLKTEAASLS